MDIWLSKIINVRSQETWKTHHFKIISIYCKLAVQFFPVYKSVQIHEYMNLVSAIVCLYFLCIVFFFFMIIDDLFDLWRFAQLIYVSSFWGC